MNNVDLVIVGAGASGLMCAIEAGKRGRSVVVIDHYSKIGEKIRISGGGRCNFTNMGINPDAFICDNPHFIKSALNQYTQWDFLDMVNRHKIPYVEKDLGQLFCEGKAFEIIDMLVAECKEYSVEIFMDTTLYDMKKEGEHFEIETSAGDYQAESFVVASGGLSIPKIGATGFGYDVAEKFKIPVITTSPALVPLTFDKDIAEAIAELAGLSVDAIVSANGTSFREGLLFTHRGLSGPSILQISSYMNDGDLLTINLLPDLDVFAYLKQQKIDSPRKGVDVVLKKHLPNRLVNTIMQDCDVTGTLADATHDDLELVADIIQQWTLAPNGTEGYRTAEVTKCGIDTNALSSKTMETKDVKGLYFIGEVVDVTGWLGGYNFQWAWSSGFVCGLHA